MKKKALKRWLRQSGHLTQWHDEFKKFIADRERSFASISHDLRTPLTRARLRVEGIEDETSKENLIGDLEIS